MCLLPLPPILGCMPDIQTRFSTERRSDPLLLQSRRWSRGSLKKNERLNVTLSAATIGAFRAVGEGNASAPTAVAIIASISSATVDYEVQLASSGWSGGATTLYDGVTGSVLQEWPSAPESVTATILESCGVHVLVVQNASVPLPRRSSGIRAVGLGRATAN